MAIYTFYLCKDDGSAASFEAFDLADDDHTPHVASAMLAHHRSAAYVSVWENERKLMELNRDGAPSASSGDQGDAERP